MGEWKEELLKCNEASFDLSAHYLFLLYSYQQTNGILDEGSVMSCHPKNSSGSVASSRKSPSTSWRGGGASSVASGRSRVKDP